MGKAGRRGSFEERRAEAIKAGRFSEIAKKARRERKQQIAAQKLAYLYYKEGFIKTYF